ncbi:CLCC1 protein, partial [Polypterus senegalus]|nr:CLCC1 protein [Polypterus senegalus]
MKTLLDCMTSDYEFVERACDEIHFRFKPHSNETSKQHYGGLFDVQPATLMKSSSSSVLNVGHESPSKRSETIKDKPAESQHGLRESQKVVCVNTSSRKTMRSENKDMPGYLSIGTKKAVALANSVIMVPIKYMAQVLNFFMLALHKYLSAEILILVLVALVLALLVLLHFDMRIMRTGFLIYAMLLLVRGQLIENDSANCTEKANYNSTWRILQKPRKNETQGMIKGRRCSPVFQRHVAKLLEDVLDLGLPSPGGMNVVYHAEVRLPRRSVLHINKVLKEEERMAPEVMDEILSEIQVIFTTYKYGAWVSQFENTFGDELDKLLTVRSKNLFQCCGMVISIVNENMKYCM